MDFIHVLILALVQGLTEFLPISSSAHLILVPVLAGWKDQGLAFDVAVHVGTLSAVVIFFRHQLIRMSIDWFNSLRERKAVGESTLAWAVIIGTVPAGLAGILLNDYVDTVLRSPLVLAISTIIFGLLLWYADQKGRQVRTENTLSLSDILFIGFAQAIALIPGTSRSGITITAGLLLGLTREAAARFSFLLSIPIIMAGGLLKTKELVETAGTVDWQAITLGVVISGLTAFLCIHYFLKIINTIGMTPFVIYRLILGGILLLIFL